MPPEIEVFLNHLAEQDLRADTIDHYRAALKEFFQWFTAATDQTAVAAVTPLDMRQFRDHLKKHQKAGTVNGKIGRLSAFFGWCVQPGTRAAN